MEKTKNAFTLIELLVSITILFLLMMMVYAPYSFYEKKARLKLASSEISQSFYEAKNMAVSWIKEIKNDTENYESENKAVWLYLTTQEWKNGKLVFYSYPYDVENDNIVLWNEENIIKTNPLQEWIKINNLSNYWNLLFFFHSISWDLDIFTFNSENEKIEILDEKIEIKFSYMNATTSSLQKKLIYFRNTNIVDYE